MNTIMGQTRASLDSNPSESQTMPPFFFEAAALLHNVDPHNLVAALREIRTLLHDGAPFTDQTAGTVEGALGLQQQWQKWAAERDLLLRETQRGRQCIEETRRDLAELRARLADWTGYELACGHNPLPDLLHAIQAKERIEMFLPAWLEGREQKLAEVTRRMEACAKQNGLEHLL